MPKNVKIDTRKLRELERKIAAAGDLVAKVGVLQGKGGDTQHEGSEFTVAEIAAVHEFGSPKNNIPERSFLRRTFREKRGDAEKILAKLAAKVVRTNLPVTTALDIAGQWGAAEVKKTITVGAGVPPPLHPITIAKKKSSRPLVDTGQLLNSITYAVGRRGE